MSVLSLARELKRQGHEVSVGGGAGDFLPQELEALKIPFVRFKTLSRSHNPWQMRQFMREFKIYLDENRFDVVHINSSNALAGAKSAKQSRYQPKTVFTLRGLTLLDKNYKKNSWLKFFYKLFFRYFLSFVDEPVFVSEENKRSARQAGWLDRGTVVRNGLAQDTRFLEQKEALKLLSAHLRAELKGKFLIGSIGRICYAKNYEFLFNIFPEILKIEPTAAAVIIGPGELSPEQKKILARHQLQDRIFFTGSINQASRFLKAFDLLVLCSRYEGLPVTLIEGLAAGVPILASAVNGVAEVLGDDKRQLYESGIENDFLNKFLDLSKNQELRKEIAQKNLERAKLFDIKNTVTGYLKLYS